MSIPLYLSFAFFASPSIIYLSPPGTDTFDTYPIHNQLSHNFAAIFRRSVFKILPVDVFYKRGHKHLSRLSEVVHVYR